MYVELNILIINTNFIKEGDGMIRADDQIRQISEAILYLLDTSKHAISTLELEKIMRHVSKILPRIIEVDASYVRLVDKRNPRLLTVEAASGFPAKLQKKIKY